MAIEPLSSLGLDRPAFESWPCLLIAVRPGPSQSTFLGFRALSCELQTEKCRLWGSDWLPRDGHMGLSTEVVSLLLGF